MQFDQLKSLPSRVTVQSIVTSRYLDNLRPGTWDNRCDGIDVVQTTDGLKIKLYSTGQQSPPKAGWTILINQGNSTDGYEWTLYGIPKGADIMGVDGGLGALSK